MRVFSIALIALVSLAQAQAEEPTDSKSKANNNCSYTVSGGQSYEVPRDASICFRSPPPYTQEYALLRCYPPLQEVDLVKRGDPRCGDRYEDRERQK
jgi:hypothetical protein